MKKFSFEDSILFENDNYIVVNKPPYVSTLEDRNSGVCLLDLAREYCNEVSVCHRLDKETSGAIVFAKNPDAYRHMAMQFENRKVDKIYHAVVEGLHEIDSKKVNAPIAVLKSGGARVDKIKGKEAVTFFSTLKMYRMHTLLEARPVTGRMHQIRVHLASMNCPIVCDEQYGGAFIYLSKIKKKFNLKRGTDEQPLIKRVALHAYQIAFQDLGGEIREITAEYPKDFNVLIKQLEKNSF
ncbi:RluA family pseudouridine synthase [Aureibacter tunicatorum]|uniref:23S rRNA pseudouridine955/2504/2580 synthase n=1 Tax=Aureibacter tunicatorum TaxID=866807 RepID=A0AAE3XSE5_9BACT|nr:RluA family pseudouridine synthase [Aureibacter tunicatorum]MDR6241036.1 23S rRNA pseudouridine955/2504/2580 synthase [Aureibacter tunicatorum]BDD03814.1 RNA pseudouridine synthase [Aureibacter tunicatorum]